MSDAVFRMSHEGRAWTTWTSSDPLAVKRFGLSYVASKTKIDVIVESDRFTQIFKVQLSCGKNILEGSQYSFTLPLGKRGSANEIVVFDFFPKLYLI